MQFLSSIFSAITAIFSWANGRSSAKNAPDMKIAAKAQSEVDANDRTAKAIAHKDIAEIRKQLAE